MLRALLLLPTLTVAAACQLRPPLEQELRLHTGSQGTLRYTTQLPSSFDASEPVPLLLLVGDVSSGVAAAVAGHGFVVVHAATTDVRNLSELLARLRQKFFVDQVGMHLGGGGEGAVTALRLAIASGHELQTLSLWDCARLPTDLPLARLCNRRVRLLAGAHELLDPLQSAGIDVQVAPTSPNDAAALAAHFHTLHAERTLPGAAGEVARTLDDFHGAAACGDEDRYFVILPDDAVFLGTDASERWTGAEFRAFAMPYFERGPAWTYVPLRRSVTVGGDGTLAWFDEVLDNEAYGACRGSGVLERRGERWVLRQYNLTIPVPNELAREFVTRIRAAAAGR